MRIDSIYCAVTAIEIDKKLCLFSVSLSTNLPVNEKKNNLILFGGIFILVGDAVFRPVNILAQSIAVILAFASVQAAVPKVT